MDLLERAVSAMKSGNQVLLDRPLDHGTEINLHIPALIPENYMSDVHTRLIMYKRIATANNTEELISLREELIDRFGVLQEATVSLFDIALLKVRINDLGVKKIDLGNNGGRIQFGDITSFNTSKIIALIQENSQVYKLDGAEKLKIINKFSDANSKLKFLHDLFDIITSQEAA